MERILIIGANGQIGSELVSALADKHGAQNVIASDIGQDNVYGAARYTRLDVLDKDAVMRLVVEEGVTQVYQLAALLSATGEKAPLKAWTLNMDGLLNILEIARERGEAGKPLKVFWPSSIAAFGPNTPSEATAQYTIMDPTTIYGISKLAGERLCEYYHAKYGVPTCAASAIRASSASSRLRAAAPPTTRSRSSTRRSRARPMNASWDRRPRCR